MNCSFGELRLGRDSDRDTRGRALERVIAHSHYLLPQWTAGTHRIVYNARRLEPKLPKPPSTYLKRMFTDTVQPHALGLKLALEFYGIDHVMYGDDYPCWNAPAALKIFAELGLSRADQQKILCDNARRVLGLRDPVPAREAATA